MSPSVAAMHCAGRTAPAVGKPQVRANRAAAAETERLRDLRGADGRGGGADHAPRKGGSRRGPRTTWPPMPPPPDEACAAGHGDRTALGRCERRNRRLMLDVRSGLSWPAAMQSRMGAGVGGGGGRRRCRQSRWCESRSLRGHRTRGRRSQLGQRHRDASGRVILVHERGLEWRGAPSRRIAPLRPVRQDRGRGDRRWRGDPGRVDGRRGGPRGCRVGLGGSGDGGAPSTWGSVGGRLPGAGDGARAPDAFGSLSAGALMPGRTRRITSYSDRNRATKSGDSGRGPTRLISPRRTCHSWGSSSSFVRTSHAPSRVSRSSPASVSGTPRAPGRTRRRRHPRP